MEGRRRTWEEGVKNEKRRRERGNEKSLRRVEVVTDT